MRHPLTPAAACLALAGLVLAGSPAQASTRSFDDARHDAPGSNDIVRTTVTNGSRIGVTIRHRDLTRSASDIQFKVRTSSGAEWTVFASLEGQGGQVYDGDFGLHPCPGLRVSRSLAKDRTALSVPRSCVGGPSGRVKLQPRVQWSADGSKGDWSVNGVQHWTPWIGH